MKNAKKIIVIGAGLAGSEAAWQAAKRNLCVELYEMRPQRQTPAHKTGLFAELVCSNSLRAAGLANAVGVLKEEMRRLNSLVMLSADSNAVPAGGALAVDREGFSRFITNKLGECENVKIIREEIRAIPHEENAVVIVAAGPLADGDLAADIKKLTGGDGFYFYDAAAPIVTAESIDMDYAFVASRYDKGEAAYINCPLSEEEYRRFWHELVNAELAPRKNFEEKEIFFEGCMPVEEMARRGEDTLLFGPLKPVGLKDPRTGETPFAAVQLRRDNGAATLYNMVGFQTHLKWGEQKRVFSMIGGLNKAEFVRYGVMHRNTFINSPRVLLPTLQIKSDKNIFFAGQMTGVEGYVESASSGLVAGINAARVAGGEAALAFSAETCHGALCRYITEAEEKNFQPMNITFGLLPPIGERTRKKAEKKERMAKRALAALDEFMTII